jgi:type VI secretion system secreted protein Hcp
MAIETFLLVRNGGQNEPGFTTTTLAQGLTNLGPSVAAMDASSFSLGGINAQNIGSGSGGAGAGKVQFNDLIVTLPTSVNSPRFQLCCQAGASIPRVTLTLIRAAGGATGAQVYSVYTFGTVFVASYANDISAGDDAPTETIHFIYGQYAINTTIQNANGTVSVGPSSGWDITHNTQWNPGQVDGPQP